MISLKSGQDGFGIGINGTPCGDAQTGTGGRDNGTISARAAAGAGAREVPHLATFRPESNHGQRSTAKQLPPERPCEHGGSVAAMDNP